MDGNKKETIGNELPVENEVISEVEDDTVKRPKSLVKSKPTTPEADGAHEKMLPKEDMVEVKASPNENQNGDAKLDIGELKTAFVGLTKEELMKYANDPFWVRLRWFLFIGFWILWGLMLLGAIMIILAAPKCSPPPPKTWWEKGPLVEVKENTDEQDIEKLTKLQVTGVIIPWPEDVYASFNETHAFIKGLKLYKDKEINVIVELKPADTQNWFEKSENKDPEFGDYYIWLPPKMGGSGEGPKPPNNWVSGKNTSSWIYSDKRKEFYYAPNGSPHLNFRNPNVTLQFSEVIKKFLRYGVGGISIKGAPNLLINEKFNDESHVQNPGGCVLTDYCFYTHSQTENVDGLATVLKQWRSVVKNNTDNGPLMISEELTSNIEAYKLNSSYVIDLPTQSHLFSKPNIGIVNIAHGINATFFANNLSWPLWKGPLEDGWDLVSYLLPGVPLITTNSSENGALLKIRESPSIMRGDLNVYLLNNDTVLAFTRVTSGNPGILVALNPTSNRTVVDFLSHIGRISEDVTVMLFSSNYNETDIRVSTKHEANSVPISPKSAIVLSYVPKSK